MLKIRRDLLFIKYRRLLILATHFFLILLSYLVSFLVRFDFSLPRPFFLVFLKTLPVLMVTKLTVFYFFGLFRGLWRYVSTGDLWQIIKANFIASAGFVLLVVFIFGLSGFPRSVFLTDFIICIFLVGGVRLLTRVLRERYKSFVLPVSPVNVLIVGAGEAGILTLREYRHNPSMGEVIGFIDDDINKHHETILGVKILGGRDRVAEVVKVHEVGEIVLAMPSAQGKVIRDLIVHCQVPGVKLKIIPGFMKILNGELEIRPREVRPEDLLGRETVSIDESEVKTYVLNKRILITGAAGSIGSELSRQVANFKPSSLVLLDHNENNLYFLTIELKAEYKNLNIQAIVGDINDVGLLKTVFSQKKPQVVFHAAAYKHVPLMEDNPLAAVRNNAFGSRNVIYAAHHYKAERFVLISTDKAVNPINVMGLTKRLAEIFLQAKSKRSKTKFMAVRFGNVLGSDGSVVPLFKKQIQSGGPVTITHPDATRYFMSIKEAVQLVLQAGAIGTGGEIFILDMGEQIKIIDLARDLVALSGLELGKDISVEYTGLRPGEKIREELLVDKDKDRVTRHGKIYISQADDFDLAFLRKHLKELQKYMDTLRQDKTIEKMKQIVFHQGQ